MEIICVKCDWDHAGVHCMIDVIPWAGGVFLIWSNKAHINIASCNYDI